MGRSPGAPTDASPATPPTGIGAGRSLKTAAEALAALRLLGANPDGVSAEQLATALGKSTSTARYLLNTLCQEGYATKSGAAGVHHLVATPPWGGAWGMPAAPARHELPERLLDAVTELYFRTRQRAYLAQWQDDATVIVDARGHQGLGRIPDLAERIPLAQAHALAVTKALVAGCDDLEARVVGQDELSPFTSTTITSTSALALELERVRRRGVAVDREEFAEGFCCVSAPILAPDGTVAASLAVSTPARRFEQESGVLARAVADVATTATRDWREQEGAPTAVEQTGRPPPTRR
jgi:DNA-binding IclR family transcriptional regulator